jgi:hypothetical protein
VAWKELGKFLSVCCRSRGILDTKFYWCFFLFIPYDKEVDREFQQHCSARLNLVVSGVLSYPTEISSHVCFYYPFFLKVFFVKW